MRAKQPHHLGEFWKAWDSALAKATPRGPRTDRDAFRYRERVERQQAAQGWMDDVCDDPVITQGGVRGATALAVCSYFARVLSATSSSLVEEINATIATGAGGMSTRTVSRTRPMWSRHVERLRAGKPATDQTAPTLSLYRLRGLDTERTSSGDVDSCPPPEGLSRR